MCCSLYFCSQGINEERGRGLAKDADFGRLVSLCAIAYSFPIHEHAPELCCSTELLVLIVPGGAQALAEPQCLNRVAGGAIDMVKLQLAARCTPTACLGCGAAFAPRCRGRGALPGRPVAAAGSPVWQQPWCLPCLDLLLKMKFLITREPMTESCCALSRRQIKPVELAEIVLEKLARFLLVLEAL